MKTSRLLACQLIFLSACTASALRAADKPLDVRIAEVLAEERYETAHWGILITEQGSRKVIYEYNAGKMFAPASTTKLYSVATALDAFGPDHRFETSVYQQGELTGDGELKGDLVLVAGGDLTLGGRADSVGRIAFQNVDHTYADFTTCHELTDPDPLAGLDELARQTAAGGIKRVRGEVRVDDTLFDKSEGTGSGPSNVTPIMVNDNVIDFLVTPDKAGAPATVAWRPKTAVIDVDARVDTVAAGSEAKIQITAVGERSMIVRGQIAEGDQPLVGTREVPDPATFARGLFIEALRRAGVTVDASPLATNVSVSLAGQGADDHRMRVALLKSPPFSEEAKLILKVSLNLHACALPSLVAVKHGKRTLVEGLQLQREFLERAGVDVKTISFADGAGGARGDFTTPRATVQLLHYMATRPDFAFYEAALPILGIDGTLSKSVGTESPARGKVHAKTGTLSWENTMNGGYLLTSKALAGYLTTASGRKLVLAMMVNNVPLQKSADTALVGQTLGRLCEIICDDQ